LGGGKGGGEEELPSLREKKFLFKRELEKGNMREGKEIFLGKRGWKKKRLHHLY